MNYEMQITVGTKNVRVFLQAGFFNLCAKPSAYHRHRYTEAHVAVSGVLRYNVDGEDVTIRDGEMYVIPPMTFHRCISATENAERLAFMVESEGVKSGSFAPIFDAVSSLAGAIKGKKGVGDAKTRACLSVICAEFTDEASVMPIPVSDRGFIIHEFFSNNYHRDITISEIAGVLHLSEKQAQRMIKQYTGNDFRTELTHRRMEATERFISAGDMSLTEIAERVGYKSYSGFWKAFRAWQKTK